MRAHFEKESRLDALANDIVTGLSDAPIERAAVEKVLRAHFEKESRLNASAKDIVKGLGDASIKQAAVERILRAHFEKEPSLNALANDIVNGVGGASIEQAAVKQVLINHFGKASSLNASANDIVKGLGDASIKQAAVKAVKQVLYTHFRKASKLDVLVVDSLDALGDAPITRPEVEQLFRLCQDHGIMCIVVAEHVDIDLLRAHEHPVAAAEPLAYCADVVVQLGWTEECGHRFRTIEVIKSRGSLHLLGPQKFKMPDSSGADRRAFRVYPTVHSWFTRYATQICEERRTVENVFPEVAYGPVRSGVAALHHGTKHLAERRQALALAITGPRHTYKVSIACEFLRACHDATGVLVLGPCPWRFQQTDGAVTPQTHKKRMWKANHNGKDLHVLHLTEGFLLPEEAMDYIAEWLDPSKERKIRRIFVTDLGDLGACYPLIMQHIEKRGPLVSALRRCFRRWGVDALFVCSTDGAQANTVIEQLHSVCDGVIETVRERNDAAETIRGTYRGSETREPIAFTLG